ncbi:MAG: serine/threonine-protein kinase [Ilumatobacteraceae bacterium]
MPQVLIERYELGRVIGAGGMAKVHLATDSFLGRTVAVKVLDDVAAKSADPASRDRFLKEARSAAGFAHHNAVSIYDAGEDNGVLFIVMEYVDGETLASKLASTSRLSARESASIASQILDALAAMHSEGILHRDVKPANVLLTSAGKVKLTDFGIAKRLDEIDEALTSAGTVIGTPRYLAPEQAVGGELGPATDVYLTGIVLHEMLTGERSPSALMGVPTQTPDPRRLRPEVPGGLAAVVTRALEYRPERRYATAGEMATALRAASIDLPHEPEPPQVEEKATQALPVAERQPDPTAVVQAASDDHRRAGADAPPTPPTQTFKTARDDEPGNLLRWIPIVAAGLLVLIVVILLVSSLGGNDTVPDQQAQTTPQSGAEFLAAIRADPEQYGSRGPEIRDQLDAVLAETDPGRRAELLDALKVNIFVWAAEGDLDTAVGGLVDQALDG